MINANAEHLGTWDKIQKFQFDPPQFPGAFALKLAREQGWSLDYAKRVIEEYRRFAFIAATTGKPVSPSDAVDQAWHQHVLATCSYWEEFCPHVLGMPFHHQPATGDPSEEEKFAQWYADTLVRYQSIFGQPAPQDIWPPDGGHANFIRVNADRHWLVRKTLFARSVLGRGLAKFGFWIGILTVAG